MSPTPLDIGAVSIEGGERVRGFSRKVGLNENGSAHVINYLATLFDENHIPLYSLTKEQKLEIRTGEFGYRVAPIDGQGIVIAINLGRGKWVHVPIHDNNDFLNR